jgi:DNA-binding ferritin-like protein
LSSIADQIDPIPASEMIDMAISDNTKIMFMIANLDKMASDAGEIGLCNFLQARHEIHRKHQWMLRATSKPM